MILLSILLSLNAPCPELLKEISKRPTEYGVYDCSNKAAEYFLAIYKKHSEARIVVIKPKRSIYTRHAVVYVNKIYVDPSTGRKVSRIWLWGQIVYKMNYNTFHIARLLYPDEWNIGE